MRNSNVPKNAPVKVKRTAVRKLTPDDLVKITGGRSHEECLDGLNPPSCLAYITIPTEP